MFSVIVSEKGGAERREVFDRTEINVGRVQGNELMLPKGNVSKRHARLLYRDGRFIITDLKSTNGTYVNGRKIAQATIVREGDKIYIGDFILRVEAVAADGVVAAPPDGPAPALPTHQEPAESEDNSHPIAIPAVRGTSPPAEFSLQATLGQPGPAPIDAQPEPPMVPAPPSSAERGLAAHAPQIDQRSELSRTGGQVISHFPLENDPDESIDQVFPGPPRVPSPRTGSVPAAGTPSPGAARTGASPSPQPAMRADDRRSVQDPSVQPPSRITPGLLTPERATPREPLPGPQPPAASNLAATTSIPTGTGSYPAASPRRAIAPPASERGVPPAEAAPQAARQRALIRLMERVRAAVDLHPLAGGASPDDALARRLEASLAEAATGLRASGELPAEVDADAVVADARRELFQLGPLEALLNDDEVTEIQAFRHDQVVITQSRRTLTAEIGWSSEAALARAVRRLCSLSGEPLRDGEVVLERALPRGARLLAVLPPATGGGLALTIRKPQRTELTLDDLVRSGTISRGMAGLLSQCVAARANVLVTGPRGSGAAALLGALAAVGGPDDRAVALQDDSELLVYPPHAVGIPVGSTAEAAARAVRAAARLRPDRMLVHALTGTLAAEVVAAIGEGAAGVIAGFRAPTLRQAIARLTADLAASRPGIPIEAAREWLASSFDLVIEIARLRDGRDRVLRVADLVVEAGQLTIRDVFTFTVERTAAGGAIEGSFHPSGVIPAIVEDLAARGVAMDTATLRRTR